MTESTYLKQNQSPTGCRPRTFHPTIDIVVPSLNNRSPPSQGYESTRMVPGCHSASQTSQHSSSHRFLNTQQSKVHHLSSLQPTPPKDNEPPSLPHSPSGCPLLSRAPVHLVKNLHVGTLRIHNCEQILAHANASQACRH
jgi:hypothetical protein